MNNRILQTISEDGVDRRGFLKCMAWAGTGMLWVVSGGILKSYSLGQVIDSTTGRMKDGMQISKGELSFVQISDSHIGFNKEANPDVVGTLRTAIARINASPHTPSFVLHTGDLTHLSKPSEFDTLHEVLKEVNTERFFFVPGEHDVLGDDGKEFLGRHGRGTQGSGWQSFDVKGVHFIGLVNVMDLKPGGMGNLGSEQIAWLKKDVAGLSDSTPIVVFAHIPLWSVYPEWGWGTDDAAQALALLKGFGSVTVLNGHIHQTMQKIEGNITFHTATSTAFPQPQPGTAPSPGPMKVPAERLRTLLGLTSVNYVEGRHSLGIVDTPLASNPGVEDERKPGDQKDRGAKDSDGGRVEIDNFSFMPRTLRVGPETTVTWTNHDDVPHTVVSTDKVFSSPVLDTDQSFSFKFSGRGTYDYFCSIHPRMTGSVAVV